jgi:hypothetical protein
MRKFATYVFQYVLFSKMAFLSYFLIKSQEYFANRAEPKMREGLFLFDGHACGFNVPRLRGLPVMSMALDPET